MPPPNFSIDCLSRVLSFRRLFVKICNYLSKRLPYLMLILLWLFIPIESQAEDKSAPAQMGFAVESVIPENQVDTTKSYFYLSMSPNDRQTIQVKIKNLQKEPVTIKIAVHDAVSSSVGAIDYAKNKPKLDPSLTDPITSLVHIKDDRSEVTIEPEEETTVSFEIALPERAFSGVKLGSLRFVRKDKEQKNQTGLIPQYARVVALMLTQDEEQFNHGADLKLKKADLQLSNGRKVVAARIQNDQPKVLQELTIQGSVQKKGEENVLAKHKMEDFSVAPNSNFDFEIPLGLEKFQPGTYVFHGKAQGDDRTWKWTKEFTIGQEQADRINDETVYRVLLPSWVPWVVGGLLLIFICLFAALFSRLRKWQAASKKNEGT
ncbi:hypothetical protein IGI67_005016 [Enterococcus sp. AZ196]